MFGLPPKWIIYLVLTMTAIATIPPVIIARARTSKTESRRIHYIQDMDNQAKRKSQTPSDLFADNRSMRPRVDGTVARTEVADDPHMTFGVVDGGWAAGPPAGMTLDMAMLERGQDRYAIYCSMCHGVLGYGDGIVHQRAERLVTTGINGTTWVQPKNVHDPEVRDQPMGQIYNTITNGIRNMSGYAAQVPTEDRWAIAAYVKAMQRSQNAKPSDLTPGEVDAMKTISYIEGEDG